MCARESVQARFAGPRSSCARGPVMSVCKASSRTSWGTTRLLAQASRDDERGATYCGGALRLPRRDFGMDLRAVGWSIEALRARHPRASAIAIAVRITQLRAAVATLIDPVGRARPWRVASPWLARGPVDRGDLDLATRAWEARGELLEGGSVALALPDYTPGEHRVVIVSPR